MKPLVIGHIYPKFLNSSGDSGNILTLKKRCEWRNIPVEIKEINLGDNIPQCDIYYLGGEQDKQQVKAVLELIKHKDFLLKEREKGAVFLGICGGYQLLGKTFEQTSGEKIEGVGLLGAYSVCKEKRFVGNVTVETDFLTPNTLVGFENHSGITYLEGDTKPLGKIFIGNGNNGEDKTEGARFKNVFGTYLHGSFLPKNTHFADYILELALSEKLEQLDDNIEIITHNSLVNKIY